MSLDPEVRRGGNLPFGMVASRWMCDPRYSTNARTLYAILVTYADTQQRNTERGKPYRPELAAQLGVSVSTVDRTLAELEAAGMVRVEPRADPDNPANNDASIYHLYDFPLMYAGNGEWTDPLPTGVRAADVAKKLIEERRAAKREQGVERRGGVPKGVNPRAVKESKAAEEPDPGQEGGSTHAATPGSTHAARVAAPMLPNIQNPLQNASPDPDAPSARSALDARRASTGSRDRAQGGSAASSKGKSSRSRLTAADWKVVNEVLPYFPTELELPEKTPPNLVQAILGALAAGNRDERTVKQLGGRIAARWVNHGHAARSAAGELERPVGVAVALVRTLAAGDRHGCADPRCEDGSDVDTGEECRACAERIADRRMERRRAAQEVGAHGSAVAPENSQGVPGPRSPTPQWWECAECAAPGKGEPPAHGLCLGCTQAREGAAEFAWSAPGAAR